MTARALLPLPFLALLMAGPAGAGTIDPGEMEIARSIVAEGGTTRFDREVEAQRKAFVKAWEKQNKGRRAEVEALFDTVALPALKERQAALLERQATFLAESLSAEELRQLLDFRRSEAGKALTTNTDTPKFGKDFNEALRDRLGLGDMFSLASRGRELGKLLREAKIVEEE